MSRGVCSPALRAMALVLLLALPAWAGCAESGDDELLAKPTDTPPSVPPTRTPPTRGAIFNTSDPGYRVDTPWRMGDGWDYESNRSGIERVRVLDQRLVNGTTLLVVETTRVDENGQVVRVARAWVDPRTWLLLNETDERGVTDAYAPGLPLRFWRNGTTGYEHTRTDASGAVLLRENVTLHARLFPSHQTLLFSWGYVEAKRVEHLAVVRGPDGSRTERTEVHWVHRDYVNDVQVLRPDGETWKLIAARAGDFRRGQLA